MENSLPNLSRVECGQILTTSKTSSYGTLIGTMVCRQIISLSRAVCEHLLVFDMLDKN
jgi:hypothetical protein